ncbi:RluA family pseudouridine synthase [Pelagibacteraceae bacterium]|nr:RluA family pseudouridine synthase [Pelagibacteraceae bacterium]
MINNTIKFSINNDEIGKRLDIILSDRIDSLTRSNLKKLIQDGNVQVDNEIIKISSKRIKSNQLISLELENKISEKIIPKKIKLNILFEDKDLLILNKPAGMVVHPGAGNYENTLVNALLYKYKTKNLSNINGSIRPGIVHRIDKETSGLLVVAKNNFSHSNLGKQFSDHTIERKYVALVWGVVRPLNGKIITLINRNKRNRQLMAVSEVNGKKSITNYKTIKVFNIKDIPRISLLEFNLETGRTHQIRVHMQYKGAPLLGDKQYGKKNIKFKKINKEFEKNLIKLNGQALHAKSLGFIHPIKKKFVVFKSELPSDLKKLLSILEKLST